MRAGQASFTAEYVAFVRAWETARPLTSEGRDPDYRAPRLFSDPYARHFLEGPLKYLYDSLALPVGGRMKEFLFQLYGSGLYYFVALRHRQMDDWMLEAVSQGLDQVVILGAGFDMRALRFEKELAGCHVIEMDFPATQQAKLKRIQQAGLREPANLTRLGVDFNLETPAHALERCADYDTTKPAFVIWEGVSMYLAPEAFRANVRAFGRFPAGSLFTFDYMLPLNWRDLGGMVALLGQGLVSGIGEPFTNMLARREMAGLLATEGLSELDDLSTRDMGSRFAPRARFFANDYARVVRCRAGS